MLDTKVGSGSCVIAFIRLHVSPIATAGRGLIFVFVGRDFYCGIWTRDLLHSTTDSDIIPISHWNTERSHPRSLRARLEPDSEEEAFSWKQVIAAFPTTPRECYAVVFLGLLELTGYSIT